jgi:hypothetical protein
LQVLASSEVLPDGKAQTVADFIATGAMQSMYLDSMRGLDIDGWLTKFTKGLFEEETTEV